MPPAPKPPPPGTGGGTSSLKFTLKEVLVEGATVFSDADLATAYQPLLGTSVSLWPTCSGWRGRSRAAITPDGFFLSRAIVPGADDHRRPGAHPRARRRGGRHPHRGRRRSGRRPDRRLPATGGGGEATAARHPGARPAAVQRHPRADRFRIAAAVGAAGRIRRSRRRRRGAGHSRRRWSSTTSATTSPDGARGRSPCSPIRGRSWASRSPSPASPPSPGRQTTRDVGQIATSWRPGLGGLVLETIFSYGDSNPGGSVQELRLRRQDPADRRRRRYPLVRARAYTLDVRAGFEYVGREPTSWRRRAFA